MRRLGSTATNPSLQVWIAGVSLVTWIVLSPVTMLTPLRSSLEWITIASLFANVATCFGWWVSALVQRRTARIEATSTQTATLAHIEATNDRIEQMEQRILDKLDAAR